MFERFTNGARHTVVLAQEEARGLRHNYIGTEHLLLGLLGEPEGIAAQVLEQFGVTRDGARDEVAEIISAGKQTPSGHIPFTPRAKKTLELALREALQLHHHYIGTEHILLGLIREGEGVAANVLRQHADLLAIRMAVLDRLPAPTADTGRRRAWLRRRYGSEAGGPETQAEQTVLSATPAADTTLSEAARLAGAQPVGSHHLLLAALADTDSAAARALGVLGIDLDRAKAALRDVDVAGTTDEPPEEAGRRAMVIRVTGDRLILEAGDPVILDAGRTALRAVGGESDVIRGDMPSAGSLGNVWQALRDSLVIIQRNTTATAEPPAAEPTDDNATAG